MPVTRDPGAAEPPRLCVSEMPETTPGVGLAEWFGAGNILSFFSAPVPLVFPTFRSVVTVLFLPPLRTLEESSGLHHAWDGDDCH
jgi:hypothetical protein